MRLEIFTALTIGFLGSTHCIGMCGGIVGYLNKGLNRPGRDRGASHLDFNVIYNAGRITSYAAIGAIGGFLGAQAGTVFLDDVVPVGRIVAGLFLILLGIYLAGWWHTLRWLEVSGNFFWKRLKPLGERFMPVTTYSQAFGLGLLWGWLPCGLVYSALVLAITASSPGEGALIMAAFGIGTLPALLLLGVAYDRAVEYSRNSTFRLVCGIAVISLGFYNLFVAFSPNGHSHTHATLGAYSALI